mgnify:CR=1 FL=1
MAGINRLAKFFKDAASCPDCGHGTSDAGYQELEQAVCGLIANCRKSNFTDDQIGQVIAVAISRILVMQGGTNGR